MFFSKENCNFAKKIEMNKSTIKRIVKQLKASGRLQIIELINENANTDKTEESIGLCKKTYFKI